MKNRNTEGRKIQTDNTEAKYKENNNNRKDNKNILISKRRNLSQRKICSACLVEYE